MYVLMQGQISTFKSISSAKYNLYLNTTEVGHILNQKTYFKACFCHANLQFIHSDVVVFLFRTGQEGQIATTDNNIVYLHALPTYT